VRIALDCRSAFAGMGGIGRYAWSLFQEFRSLAGQHEVFCYFSHLPPPGPVQVPENFRVRIIESGMVDERFDQFILPSLLEEDEVDVYHNPTFSVPSVHGKTRLVSTVHDVVFVKRPDLVEPRLREYLDKATRRAARGASRIITVSDFSARGITECYEVPSASIAVIPNGVHPPAQFSDSSKATLARLGIPAGEYVLYVGSIEPKKNLELLLQALDLLRTEDGNRPHLVLAGSHGSCAASLRSELENRAQRGAVTLTGHVTDPDLEALYADAALFVYPSLYEGFGLPPLEAMLRGVPTIVADSTSLPEVVGDAALKVDSAKPEALAQAMRTLLADAPKRNKLSDAGRTRAAEFTWKRSAAAHLGVYEAVAALK
jgi:glycosyltransferase involved in cell wall biosynthesis